MSILSHLTPALPFLLTYAVHSTVLLVCAWAIDRLLGEERTATREGLWRFALVGALLSASLQVGLKIEPVSGRLELPRRVAPAAATPNELLPAPPHTSVSEPTSGGSPGLLPSSPTSLRPQPPAGRTLPSLAARAAALLPEQLAGALATSWLAITALLLLRLAVGHALLHRRIADRRPLGGRLRRRLDELAAHAGLSSPVALTASHRLCVPLALGLGRREICLPQAVLGELDAHEQDAVLAHELAHLCRRDPQWVLFARLLESLLFLQPLHRTARRRLQDLAELRSDDWASAALGSGLGLARCLATVAGWQLAAPPGAAAPLAARRSQLRRRVERLVALTPSGDTMPLPRASLRTILVGLALVVLTSVAAPGVSLGSAQAPSPPPAPSPSARPSPPTPGTPAAAPQPLVAVATVAPLVPLAPSPAAKPAPPSPAARPATPEPHAAPLAQEPETREAEHEEELAAVESREEMERSLEEELEAMEETLEEVGRSLEEELAPLHGELESQLESLESEMEANIEPALRQLDEAIEQAVEAGAITTDVQQQVRVIQDVLAELQPSIQHAVEATMRLHQPLQDELMAAVQAATQRIDYERLHELTSRIAADSELAEEERRALHEELRRLVEQSKPTAEELATLRQQARAAAEAARPTQEEMEALRVELEQAAERVRERLATETQKLETEPQERPE